MELSLVLLGAGKGSRFGGLKQLKCFGPQEATLAEFAIYDAWQNGFRHFVAVVSPETRAGFESIFRHLHIENCSVCVEQQLSDLPVSLPETVLSQRLKPWGTAHALWCARRYVKTPFVVINGDDFYGRNAYALARKFFEKHEALGLVSYPLGKTLSDNGYVSRGICGVEAGKLSNICEYLNIERKGDKIVSEGRCFDEDQPTSMNFWMLQPSIFEHLNRILENFVQSYGSDPKREIYLPTSILEVAQSAHVPIHCFQNTQDQWMGVTYTADVEHLNQSLAKLTDRQCYPSSLVFDC